MFWQIALLPIGMVCMAWTQHTSTNFIVCYCRPCLYRAVYSSDHCEVAFSWRYILILVHSCRCFTFDGKHAINRAAKVVCVFGALYLRNIEERIGIEVEVLIQPVWRHI